MNNTYLSKENTQCMKGIFALCVLCHHLYQYSGMLHGTYFGAIFQALGYLSVGMFFFFSGYGLTLSSKKEGYIKSFLRKRLLPLYVFYCVLIILYAIFNLLIGKQIAASSFFKSFLFGGTIVGNGWYLQATFVLYLIFYFVFRFIKKQRMRIIAFAISLVAYCVLCHIFGLSNTWYESIFCALFGMLTFEYKDRLDELFAKRAILIVCISGVGFVICFVGSYVAPFAILFKMASSLFFAFGAISLAFVLQNTSIVNNRITKLLGNYSLEIYVSQAFMLGLKKGPIINISNPFLFLIIAIIGTAFISFFMKYIYKGVTKSVLNIVG